MKKRTAAAGPSRSELKNAAARAELEQLEPGERPGAVVAAVVTAIALAIANFVAFAAGVEVKGQKNGALGIVLFAIVMLTAAWGMWNMRYWAVLGFQALLALTILIAALSLTVASNIAALALSLVICGFGGWLFFRLVKAMARIQMPDRTR